MREREKFWMVKLQDNRPLETLRHKWEVYIKMGQVEILYILTSTASGYSLMVGFCECGNEL
jgi:hypothetical protein